MVLCCGIVCHMVCRAVNETPRRAATLNPYYDDATAVLREAAAAMRGDAAGGVFLYSVMSLLENKAVQIDQHAARLVDPATPERVFADVYKVARAYLQEGLTDSTYCTCGHHHDPDAACAPECGCRP